MARLVQIATGLGALSGALMANPVLLAIGAIAGGVYLIVNMTLAARLRSRKIRADSPPGAQIVREILASLP